MSVSLGISLPYVEGVITSGTAMAEFGGIVEGCGLESIWAVEHLIEADDYEPLYPYSPSGRMPSRFVPMAEPLELLSFLAGQTTSVRLGTAVMVAPLHSPVLLAKRAATLDRLSGDRLILGLGIGWQREEYASVGVPYADRGARLEEAIEAMRVLWADRPASYQGRFTSFDRVHLLPSPAGGRIPIVLGGNSAAAIRRCARVGDGWYPHALPPDDFAVAAELLRSEVRAAGRSPADVPISVTPTSADPSREWDLAWAQGYVDAGATRIVMRPGITAPEDLSALRGRVTRYQEEVLGALDLSRQP